MRHLQSWANHAGTRWKAIKLQIDDTLGKARELSSDALHTHPMIDEYKDGLRDHWSKLHKDFRVEAN